MTQPNNSALKAKSSLGSLGKGLMFMSVVVEKPVPGRE